MIRKFFAWLWEYVNRPPYPVITMKLVIYDKETGMVLKNGIYQGAEDE